MATFNLLKLVKTRMSAFNPKSVIKRGGTLATKHCENKVLDGLAGASAFSKVTSGPMIECKECQTAPHFEHYSTYLVFYLLIYLSMSLKFAMFDLVIELSIYLHFYLLD